MEVEKIKAMVEVPFIQFQLPNFTDIKQSIIDSIEKEAVPNIFEPNFPKALRTPWFMMKYKAIKWLADQVTHTIGKWDKCKEGTLICDEIWGIITQSKLASRSHSHYPATWSAVMYISCPEGSGRTVWPDIDKKVKPIDGNVCVFPGYLNHYVEASAEGVKRMIVSCNIYTNRRKTNG
tara:strand:- start:162 stop:695 length:534 start_codon:yes stop_codon:yes gene_type:complete